MRIQRQVLIALFCLMATVASRGQSQDTDSQTLRAILAELRAIHEDMRVTETTQLLVAELEMQQAVVSRATESADNARERLDNVLRNQKQLASELENLQDRLDKATDSDLKNHLSQSIEQMKSNTDQLKVAERDSNTNLQDMHGESFPGVFEPPVWPLILAGWIRLAVQLDLRRIWICHVVFELWGPSPFPPMIGGQRENHMDSKLKKS